MTASFRKVISDYKAFILDMDGTLYYQIPVRICMAVELFFYYICHLNKISDLFLIYAYRKNSELGILQKPNSNITVWMQEKPKKYIHFFRDKKLIAFVQAAQQQGIKIVVYSDYPLKKKLEALAPFKPDFSFSADNTEIQCLKPNNKGLLYIVNVLNIDIEDIIFIGDRFEKDAVCAKKTSMDYLILGHTCFTRNRMYNKIKIVL